jgi:hypothetical protein
MIYVYYNHNSYPSSEFKMACYNGRYELLTTSFLRGYNIRLKDDCTRKIFSSAFQRAIKRVFNVNRMTKVSTVDNVFALD